MTQTHQQEQAAPDRILQITTEALAGRMSTDEAFARIAAVAEGMRRMEVAS